MLKSLNYTNTSIKGTLKYGYDALTKTVAACKGKKILDYGSGTGRSTKVLSKIYKDVSGADIRSDMISTTKKLYPNINFRLIKKNKISWPNNTFDVVVSAFIHIEIGNLFKMKQMTKEIKRVLKPRGKFIILTINPKSWGNQYRSFSSSFPKNFTATSGQKVNVLMASDRKKIKFQDYYWQNKDYVNTLGDAGFKQIKLKKIKAEKDPPPFLVIEAVK